MMNRGVVYPSDRSASCNLKHEANNTWPALCNVSHEMKLNLIRGVRSIGCSTKHDILIVVVAVIMT